MTGAVTIHPAATIFPDMADDEFAGLVADIREHGQREPIVLHEGAILDGRNRYRACHELGITPRFIEWAGEGSPEAFVVSLNLHRRHLSESQRAMVAGRLTGLKAGSNQHSREVVPIGTTSAKAAMGEAGALLNVSRGSVARARVVLTRGTPEEIEAVEKGKVAVSAVAKAIRAKATVEQRREIVNPGVLKNARGRAFPTRPLQDRMSRCLDQLEGAIETLSQFAAEPADVSDIASWIARMERARTGLSRIINASRERSAA